MLDSTSVVSANSPAPLSLLQRIADDAEFRTLLESDPATALANVGIHLSADELPAQVTLPRVDDLRSAMTGLPDPESDPTKRDDSPIIYWQVLLG